jgi:hypothetical protein
VKREFPILSSEDDYEVEYTYRKANKATYRNGELSNPPEGAEIEITSVRVVLPDGALGMEAVNELGEEDIEGLMRLIEEEEG